jgi:hypothetical protein
MSHQSSYGTCFLCIRIYNWFWTDSSLMCITIHMKWKLVLMCVQNRNFFQVMYIYIYINTQNGTFHKAVIVLILGYNDDGQHHLRCLEAETKHHLKNRNQQSSEVKFIWCSSTLANSVTYEHTCSNIYIYIWFSNLEFSEQWAYVCLGLLHSNLLMTDWRLCHFFCQNFSLFGISGFGTCELVG